MDPFTREYLEQREKLLTESEDKDTVRFAWVRLRNLLLVALTVALLVGVITSLIVAGSRLAWTGFSNKTLWDWLNLLGVLAIPAVVGFGGAWFSRQQEKVNDNERNDNQRETALQGYIDKMSELLLEKQLRHSQSEDEVRKIARVRTLTVLPMLDAYRRGIVYQFLQESGLIDKGTYIIDLNGADLRGIKWIKANLQGVNLRGANLQGANLSRANLQEANLSRANLQGARLTFADLSKANLHGADLREANLHDADLTEANLRDAFVTVKQLEKASSLLDTKIVDPIERQLLVKDTSGQKKFLP